MEAKSRSARWLRRLRDWARSLDFTLARRFGLATREDRIFFILVALVGVMSGALGIAVHFLIEGMQSLLWRSPDELIEVAAKAPRWLVVAAPAVGGVLVGLIAWIARGRVGGGGMANMIEAVALSGGKIAPKPVIANALAAVATVGAGGSLGREGPMIRLGAMVSSWLGSRLGLEPHRIKVLVGCGAASGMAAIYNVPVGGTLFAMEVILGNFALDIFGPIVASSVISTLIFRSVMGNAPLYAARDFTVASGWEILLYLGLGVVGALASVLFVFGVRLGRVTFRRMTLLPEPLKPLVGLTLVGVMALWVPHVLGPGRGAINLAVAGNLGLPEHIGQPRTFLILLLLGLAVAKLAATALTAGSGGAGGLFTPSMVFGALVGNAYGIWVQALWPDAAAPVGAYAVVGMAAIAAGTSHAPISAILILFEFTGNYDLILPLMVASITASLLARRLQRHSIYTESLSRRGVELPLRMEEAVLAGLKAEDLARPDLDILRPGDHYPQVVDKFLATRRQRLFVVGTDGRLLGAVSLHDIKHALEHPELLTAVVAHDLMLPVDRSILKDERLHRATEYFAHSDFERLPVVDEAGKLLGVLAKRDLLAVYAQEVLGRPAMMATFVSSRESQASRQYVELPPDFSLRMVPLPPDLAGKTLAEARLPQTLGARVLEIRRPSRNGEDSVLPAADTLLESGDVLLLLGPTESIEALMAGKMKVEEAALASRPID